MPIRATAESQFPRLYEAAARMCSCQMTSTPARASIRAATVSNALDLIAQTIPDQVAVRAAPHKRFRSPMQRIGTESRFMGWQRRSFSVEPGEDRFTTRKPFRWGTGFQRGVVA